MDVDKGNDWDVVDQASLESFPASDPPGWGSAHATTCPTEIVTEAPQPSVLHRLVRAFQRYVLHRDER